MDRIALAVGSNGGLADFFSITEIIVYEKKMDWTIEARIRVSTDVVLNSTASVRQKAENIGREILEKNCNIIVGKEIIGIPYHAFCKAGLEVFEADKISKELFAAIYEDYLAEKNEAAEIIEMVPPEPIPTDDEGNYFFDFMKAIKCHPELSSKKMLIPFLLNDLFFSLLIRCEHIMPWLDDFVKTHGLKIEAKCENGRYDVLITHESCRE